MKKRLLALFFTTIFSLLLSADPVNPMIWQENGVPLRKGTNIEWQKTAASVSDGVVYIWSDTQSGGRDIYAQKVLLDGTLAWSIPKQITDRANRQEDPVAIGTSDDNVIIAWVDYLEDNDGNVYAQKIDSDGNIVWQNPVSLCSLPAEQKSLNIVPDNQGGAYVLWEDKRAVGIDLYGQHITSNGSVSWAENGLELAGGNGNQYRHSFWENSEDGTAVAIYANRVSEEVIDIYAVKVNSSGIVWGGTDNPKVLIADEQGTKTSAKICPDGQNGYYFAWVERAVDNTGDIQAQRIDSNGNLVWNSPAVISNVQGVQLNPRVTVGSDNHLFVAWESIVEGESNSNNVWAQKVSPSGQIVWAQNGIELVDQLNEQRNPRLVGDDNGGVIVCWDDTRDVTAILKDIYAQRVNADGEIQWEVNGKPICNMVGTQDAPSIRKVNDKFFIAWGDKRTGSVGIYYQLLNENGDLTVVENGELLFWGLSGDVGGDTDSYCSASYEDKTYFVWNDTRFGALGWKVMIQSIDTEGNLGFAENGSEVTEEQTPGSNQKNIDMIVTNDGVAVCWQRTVSAEYHVFAQLISHSGERMWGENGIDLTPDVSSNQKKPYISYREGAYYVLWNDGRLDDCLQVFGQKIVNGERQWGNSAKAITSDTAREREIAFVDGPYFGWKRQNFYFICKYDDNGDIAQGWDEDGIICKNKFSQQITTSQVDDKLLVLWVDKRTNDEENGGAGIYGQLFNSDGTLGYEEGGKAIAENDLEQIYPCLSIDGDSFYVTWTDNSVGAYKNVMIQKYDIMSGEPVYANNMYVSQQNCGQNLSVNRKIGNELVLVLWENSVTNNELSNVDIMSQIFVPSNQTFHWGDGLGTAVTDINFDQINPTINPINNDNTMVAWRDKRESGKTPIISLYAQLISTPTSNQEAISVNNIKVYDSYPNPFYLESLNKKRASATTIKFEMSESSKVSASIYNIKGQKVKTLVNKRFDKGINYLTWNGKNQNNQDVSAGVYFYKIETNKGTITKKMLILK